MEKKLSVSYLVRHFCGRVKKVGSVTCYACFCPVFRIVTRSCRKDYYFFGIRVYRKKLFRNLIRNEVERECQEMRQELEQLKHTLLQPGAGEVWRLKMDMLENRILCSYLYRNERQAPRYALLFDCLYDQHAEAIDAMSLFLYMQEHQIPAKYVLREDNKLAEKLQENPDVVFVRDMSDFVSDHCELIAGARCILTSFGLATRYDGILKHLPFAPYIFIEHGVTFFKEHVTSLYGPTYFDKTLVSSRGTYELYSQNNAWAPKDMIRHGMPRWDLLTREAHAGKNIFVFFTWRTTFNEDLDYVHSYFEKINALLSHPGIEEIVNRKGVAINLVMHHEILRKGVLLPEWGKHVNIVEMEQISSLIGKSDLLITDFSSVCFDFMFLDIPVIFYRFDYGVPQLNALDQSMYENVRSKDESLYNCVYQEQDVLRLIRHYVDNDFVLEEENVQKNASFFWEKKDVRARICESLETICAGA